MSGIPEITSYPMPEPSQIPTNVANWKIDPIRAVLLVHDMQKYFVRKIPLENPRISLVQNAASIRQYCIESNIPVVFTGQSGGMTEQQRGLLKDFWGMGMKVDPVDRLIVDELSPAEGDLLFNKWRYSAFHKSDLFSFMQHAKRDQLIICGVYAHIGVLITAVDAFSHDIQPFIVADAVADFSQQHHIMALNYAAKCCAVVTFTEEVIEKNVIR